MIIQLEGDKLKNMSTKKFESDDVVVSCAWCGIEVDLAQKHYGSPDSSEKIHIKCGEDFKNSRGLEEKLPVIKGGEDK